MSAVCAATSPTALTTYQPYACQRVGSTEDDLAVLR